MWYLRIPHHSSSLKLKRSMKNVLSATLLLIFVLSPISATFAQKSRSSERRASRETANSIQFGEVSALADRQGVLVQWTMTAEHNSLGYYVYRVDDGIPTRVNEKITLGSATKAGVDVDSAESYHVYDPQGVKGSSYFVESFSLGGERSESPTVGARSVRDLGAATGLEMESLRAAGRSKNEVVESNSLTLNEELNTEVTSSLQTADPNLHQIIVGLPGAIINVRKDGLYRVPAASLQAASFPVNIDSAYWKLFLEGVEQPINVGPGAQYIEFFGKGVDTAETDLRAYYLVVGNTPGKRIPTRTLRPLGGNVASQSFPAKTSYRQRSLYLNTVLNGDGQNYWGTVIASSQAAVPFTVRGIDTSNPTTTLNLRLQGFTTVSHLVNASVNGNPLGLLNGNSRDSYGLTFQVPTSQLVEGTNTLNLTSIGGSGDFSLFDEITIDYKRKYSADQNVLTFTTPGYRRANITNFSSANVRVFDITADGDTQLIKNAAVVQEGATFTAKLPSSRAAVYYAVEDSALLTPASVIQNIPSNLKSTANAANLVIISHSAPDFMAAAETWANYRRGQGFAVKVVDVRDIYDEFNYGVVSSLSIKNFLQHASQNWQIQPQYVLLLGDGSYDARNYEGFGSWNLIPSRMINTQYGEIASDESLADFNDDGLSELSIGRIPARTAAQVTSAFNKTTTFELPAMQSLTRGVLFAYDEPKGYDFGVMSTTLRNKLPFYIPATMVDRLAVGSATTLMAGLNAGQYIVNYSGHGSSGVWYNSGFFGLGQAQSITNSPSIFTMLTCFNGYFIRPDADSLGERLLNSTVGGSVVSWASTTETTPDVQLVMAERFYEQLNLGFITRVGDLVRDAKQSVPANGDVRYSWVLLGDPMLKVR
jgi:hypothetical protein